MTSNEDIQFGNYGKVEINFIEMTRQLNRLVELRSLIIPAVNNIKFNIDNLNSLIGGSVEVGNISQRMFEKFDIVISGMEQQLNDYTEINNQTYESIVKLRDFAENVTNSTLVTYGEDGSTISYSEALKKATRSYTPTNEYDMSNLRGFIETYEGCTEVYIDPNGVKYYRLEWDVNGYAAGPGIHVEHIGNYTSPYQGYAPADVVDAAADKLLGNIRLSIETALQSEPYKSLELTDSQIDSMTSLLYNTGQQPEYFLDRYVGASNNGQSLYEYTTQYWVNAGGTRLDGLVIRRAGEHVLAEQGYDAWVEWSKEHPCGSSTSNLGL